MQMAEREWILDRPHFRLILVGVISGLTSEVEIVRSAVERHRPSALGLTITGEEIDGIRKWNEEENTELPPYSDFDRYYIREMSRFGDVRLPSPSLAFLIEFAGKARLPVYPLDMDEDEYSEIFLKHVSPASLFFSSLLRSRRRRKILKGNAEEVACEIDRMSMHPKGVETVELERDRHISRRILTLAGENTPFMAIINYERLSRILAFLNEDI
jgi:hypothetical protein